ncbi:MAG: hypothetical protein HY696_05295 [Deltaproteobacteria bacterium]|nr:hypothetical protein [Deltaproteobacteria bacterium]
MQFRLMLDRDQVDQCRKGARELAKHIHRYVDRHTSESVEVATLRSLGVTGDHQGQTLAAAVVEKIGKERLREGAAYWLGAVMATKQCDVAKAAHQLVRDGCPDSRQTRLPHAEIRQVTKAALQPFQHTCEQAARRRVGTTNPRRRTTAVESWLTVASGDGAADVRLVAELASGQATGAVLHPPFATKIAGLTAKPRGWRNHYAVLDVVKKCAHAVEMHAERRQKAPFAFVLGGCGAATLEAVTASVATELTGVEFDLLTAARCHGLHFKRALVDQQFLYRICGKSGIGLLVAGDGWRAVADGYAYGHELVLGHMLIEALATMAGVPFEGIVARLAPVLKEGEGARSDRVAHELAHLQVERELFPQAPLFMACAATTPDPCGLHATLAVLCGLDGAIVDTLTAKKVEQQRLHAAREHIDAIWRHGGDVAEELTYIPNGKIHRRAHTILEKMQKTLQQLQRRDLLKLGGDEPAPGLFAIPDSGVGLDGVLQKHKYYWNPLEEWLLKANARSHDEADLESGAA